MFGIAYAIVLLISILPLARTFLRGRGGDPPIVFLHRLYRDFAYVAIAILVILGFETALTISLQNYWFTELGQPHRYWFALRLRVAIFLTILVGVGGFIGYNLRRLSRPLPAVPRSAPWFAGFFFAALVGLGATQGWMTLMGFLGAAPSGASDPVFGRDLAFYLLALPWYDDLVGIVTTVLVVTIALWAFTGLAFYPKSGRPWDRSSIRRRRPLRLVEVDEADPMAQDIRIWEDWLQQGLMLAALFCLAMGAARFFGRFHLVIDGHSEVVAGGSYADIRYWIPAYNLIMACWFAAACLLLAAAGLRQLRRRLAASPGVLLLPIGLFAVLYLGAVLIPPGVEQVYVGPNQITLERPYLVRSIAGTRAAYNLAGPSVDEREFAVSARPLGREDLDRNGRTLQDARIWDWRALEPQLQQIQGLRPYYSFAGVDIDRYRIDGVERQVMITPRELDLEKLPPPAQVWVNLALKYTHGYGVVAVPVNEMDGRGNPVLWAQDIPIRAKGDLAVTHGEIYYGFLTDDRVYVHTTEKEFDYPRGQANAETVYSGVGGIVLSSFWRKLVVAREGDGIRLFVSSYFLPDSRVLLRRNVVERVARLAPFLTFDRDPYIVANGDHYSFIIDAYTSSANYPYSAAYDGALQRFRGKNYLRNSVKAVVDAYNGSTTFYVFDEHDPIVGAYRRMLPGFFKERREMPPNLRRHIRYPEDLFTIQAEIYGTYHMTNPTTFYNREDRWEVPHELYRDREIEMPPYYVMAQLTNAEQPEFLLMLPLSVAGKNQMAGWLAGRSDGANYGKLVAFRFPKGVFVDGPAQVESRINSDSRFSGDLTLWDQHGSHVIRGNLIVLPLDRHQLTAIEPIYIEAEQTKIPTLARVVLAQLMPDDRKIEWAGSLDGAEDLLVGAPARPAAAVDHQGGLDRLAQARAVFREMQQQYAAGNFTRYGELLKELERLLAPP
jgi:uncharacterized membrane protein (UPF0182 family)